MAYLSGSVVFAGDTSKAVTFGVPMSDANYTVAVSLTASPATSGSWWITAKTPSGFIINFANAQTQTIEWATSKNI
jgi:hypothetical protein